MKESLKKPKIYCLNGYVYVRHNGKMSYLGKAETEAAERRYRAYLKEQGLPEEEYFRHCKTIICPKLALISDVLFGIIPQWIRIS
jgi:hypothetical protein